MDEEERKMERMNLGERKGSGRGTLTSEQNRRVAEENAVF